MSDFDWIAVDLFANGTCPDCGGREFVYGPRGGLARNYGCVGCAAWYNITVWQGALVFAQRIERGARPGEETWPRGPLPVTAPAQEPAAECSPRRPR